MTLFSNLLTGGNSILHDAEAALPPMPQLPAGLALQLPAGLALPAVVDTKPAITVAASG